MKKLLEVGIQAGSEFQGKTCIEDNAYFKIWYPVGQNKEIPAPIDDEPQTKKGYFYNHFITAK